MNAREEIVTVACHCEGEGGEADFFDGAQGGGVGGAVATELDGGVVAALFAGEAHLAGSPPDGGVIEEEGFHDDLEDVDEIVVAADVGEFMGEDGFELIRGKARKDGGRDEDDGLEPAEEERGGDAEGFFDLDGEGDAKAVGEVVEFLLDVRGYIASAKGAEALEEEPAAEMPEAEGEDAEAPEGDGVGEIGLNGDWAEFGEPHGGGGRYGSAWG